MSLSKLCCAVQSASNRDTQRWTAVLCRAYKLGKKRWSYNQVELIMHNDEDESQLQVVEAVQHSPPALTDAQKVCSLRRQRLLLGFIAVQSPLKLTDACQPCLQTVTGMVQRTVLMCVLFSLACSAAQPKHLNPPPLSDQTQTLCMVWKFACSLDPLGVNSNTVHLALMAYLLNQKSDPDPR